MLVVLVGAGNTAEWFHGMLCDEPGQTTAAEVEGSSARIEV